MNKDLRQYLSLQTVIQASREHLKQSDTCLHISRGMNETTPLQANMGKKVTPPELAWYQKPLIFKPGFQPWQIIVFVVGILGANWFLAVRLFPKPSLGTVSFDPSTNSAFRTLLWTSVVLFLKTLAMPWTAVYFATKNNSFTRNPEDLATGEASAPAKLEDPMKERFNRIHQNDMENVPFMIILGFFMILVNPADWVAKLLLLLNLFVRLLHTAWYAIAGSHEIRATLWSMNCFCMVGFACQVLRACEII